MNGEANINKKSQKSSAPTIIRVVLADGYPLILLAERTLIEAQHDIKILAETADGKDAVDLVLRLHPDIAILDEGLRIINGIEATRQIVARCPETKVIITTSRNDTDKLLQIYRAGASNYFFKMQPGDLFIRTIRKTFTGENLFPENVVRIAKIKTTIFDKDPSTVLNPSTLTSRERQLLELIAQGISNKQIAVLLGMKLQPVKESLSNLYLKLGVSSRVGAITVGLKNKFISLEDTGPISLDNPAEVQ